MCTAFRDIIFSEHKATARRATMSPRAWFHHSPLFVANRLLICRYLLPTVPLFAAIRRWAFRYLPEEEQQEAARKAEASEKAAAEKPAADAPAKEDAPAEEAAKAEEEKPDDGKKKKKAKKAKEIVTKIAFGKGTRAFFEFLQIMR